MQKSKIKKIFKFLILLIILYFLPFLLIIAQYKPTHCINDILVSDTAIVFGTLVRNKIVSPLLKERLDTSIELFLKNKVQEIVVSNTTEASKVMYDYLIDASIPSSCITLDITAEKTSDTCHYEKNMHPNLRKLIFVSQGYHLPRISYQCKKIGVLAILLPAENIDKKRLSFFSSWKVFSIRAKRYIREAGLTWLVVLNIYR